MKKYGIWLCVCMGILFSGCSNKKIVEVDQFSTKIIMDYTKKQTPDGWFWNFGVGDSYGEAIADASKSLSFEDSVSIQTEIIVSSPEKIATDSYGNNYRIPAHKITNTKGNKIFKAENTCEIHKVLVVKDGTLVIRICKDNNYFLKLQEKNKLKFNEVHVMNSIDLFFDLNIKKGKYPIEDYYYIYSFLKEIRSLNESEIWWAFPNNSKKDIENFVLTTYKTWLKNFPKDIMFKQFYGIIYPYEVRMSKESGRKEFSQLWSFNEYPKYKFIIGRTLTTPQILGLSEIDFLNGLTLDKSSKVNYE